MAQSNLIVGYETALDYWRAARVAAGVQHVLDDAGRVFGARERALTERASLAASLCNSSLPIDVVIDSKKHRHCCAAVHDRVYSGPLLQGHLYSIEQNLSVVRPGPMLVQLASDREEIEIALLACELCGTYGLTPWAEDTLQTGLTALSSKAELLGYAKSASSLGVRGAKRAAAGIALATADSASPRESELAVFLALSRNRGGAGLPGFVLNQSVDVSVEQRVSVGGSAVLRPDILWENQKVAVEYDSNEHHLTLREKERDEARRRVFGSMGYSVFVVTNELLKDMEKLDLFVDDLTKKLGVRRPPLSERQEASRCVLVEKLFGV